MFAFNLLSVEHKRASGGNLYFLILCVYFIASVAVAFSFYSCCSLNNCKIAKVVWDMFATKQVIYKKDANKQIVHSSNKLNQSYRSPNSKTLLRTRTEK